MKLSPTRMIFDLAARYSALCFVPPQLTSVSAAMQARPFFLTTTIVDINLSHVLSSFFQRGVFLDHLLVTIAGEVDRQFGVLTLAFAFDDQTYAVFRVTNTRPDLQSCWARRAALVRTRARLEIARVDLPSLPGEKFFHALCVIVGPALIIARRSRWRRRRARRFAARDGRSPIGEA